MVATNGNRTRSKTMEFVIAKKMDPRGERKKRTVAAMVRSGVTMLLNASFGSGLLPPPPGGRLYPIWSEVEVDVDTDVDGSVGTRKLLLLLLLFLLWKVE